MAMRIFELYLSLLRKYPLKTRMLTAAFIGGLGNYLSQKMADSNKGVVWRRVLRFAALQFLLTPVHAVWYPTNADLAARVSADSPKVQVLVRVLLDQLIYSPMLNATAIFLAAVLGGESAEGAARNVRGAWASTQMRSWCVWPFAQLMNYSVVPAELQIFFANLVGLLWTIIFSRLLQQQQQQKQKQGRKKI